MRVLAQLYATGSYCTCASVYQTSVSEVGRIRHQETVVLPGLSLGQSRFLPDLSQVQARLWATIVAGPGGSYGLSVRIHEDGRKAATMVRRLERLKKGQEFELTAGPQRPMRLRTRIPYRFTVEARNPRLRPAQLLAVEGRACLYFVSGS